MSVSDFLTHIHASSPLFHCYACGDKSEKLSLDAQLSHRLGPPIDLTGIQLLQEYLGPQADGFVNLYSEHDGLSLYRDQKGDAIGLRLFPIESWESQTQDLKYQFEAMGFEIDNFPSGARDCLVFGEIPHSGNSFTVKVSGWERGTIYYADHDDFSADPFARSFDEFLSRIIQDPAQFLYDVGCYTRYSDGKSAIQWIPKQFQSAD